MTPVPHYPIMKIITWNVGHQASHDNRKNLSHMAEALAALSPDIIVLTEYAPNEKAHDKFSSNLESFGFKSLVSKCPAIPDTENHVLIASRMPMIPEESDKPPDSHRAIPSNALLVTIPKYDLGILGLRQPVEMKAAQLRCWWDWVTGIAERNRNHPFIFLGDFNTDESSKGPNGGNRIKILTKNGWQHAQPEVGASYWARSGDVINPFYIDHAFFSPHFTIRKAEYLYECGEYIFVKKPGEQKPKALSDHAVLMVEFDLD